MRHAGPLMVIPKGLLKVVKEILRHLLRRPVVGVTILAEGPDGRLVLIRRADSGKWALPGGTVEWGETLRSTAVRELQEEAGVETLALGELCGVYSAPERDPRFHAVTVVVRAKVLGEMRGPDNPVEILESRFFARDELPQDLSHGTGDMLDSALEGRVVWE
jgi:8-oxo-dGTP diphosphatase